MFIKTISPTSIALLSALAAPCYATDYLSVEQAQKLSFPAGIKFEKAHIVFSEAQKKEIEEQSGIPVAAKAQKIWNVYGVDNQKLGWFVIDYVIGKHLLIDYAVAIGTDRRVLDVEILSYRESYGGEIRSEFWLNQFDGKTAESQLNLYKDITNMSGATLSSRHVTEGIKRVLATINATQK